MEVKCSVNSIAIGCPDESNTRSSCCRHQLATGRDPVTEPASRSGGAVQMKVRFVHSTTAVVSVFGTTPARTAKNCSRFGRTLPKKKAPGKLK